MFYCRYPCLQTAHILLQCNAAVNAFDAVRNTPLHVIASSKSACDKSILKLLCDAGAHLDCVNALGQTPIDLATIPDVKQLLKIRMKLSLKCLCARLIRKKNVPFREKIAISLVNFVEKH
jgi:ankyrin repeat protein